MKLPKDLFCEINYQLQSILEIFKNIYVIMNIFRKLTSLSAIRSPKSKSVFQKPISNWL
jgi:hypothetical protein